MKQQFYLFLCIAIVIPVVVSRVSASSGTVELDELNFDKITKKFGATLVKFDIAFPYGDKHEAYVALAKDTKDVDDFLVAEVGVKDYGEKENEALALKYGAVKDKFPVVKLFIPGSEPITFDDSRGFTTDELKRFIREKLNHIQLTLPGCISQLDTLAAEFMKSDKGKRKDLIKKAEQIVKELDEKRSTSGKIYIKLMEKVVDNGDEFVTTEIERLKKILSGKISDKKKEELNTRMNIVQSFQIAISKAAKEDL